MTVAGNNDVAEIPAIAEWETLARAVTDGEEAKFANRTGDVHPRSFTRPGRRDISVDRFSRMEQAEAVENGHAVAAERGVNRRFRGWALITKTAVDDLGYIAKESPVMVMIGTPTFGCPKQPRRIAKCISAMLQL